MAVNKTTKKAVKRTMPKKEVKNKIVKDILERVEVKEEEGIDPMVLNQIDEKNEEVEPTIEKQTETMNGDPSVIIPIEKDEIKEIEKEAMKETFKENKRNNKIVGNTFGYSWNGVEIDF